MGFTHIWFFANADLQDRLRTANERRAAAAYDVFRRVGRVLGGIARMVGRIEATRRRRRQVAATVRELNALDDDILQDIGIPRGIIRDVAHALAEGEAVAPPANDAERDQPTLALVVDRPARVARPARTAATIPERRCA